MAYKPPFKVTTGSIENRLMDSQAVPTRQDSIHFRKLGTISGDTGTQVINSIHLTSM